MSSTLNHALMALAILSHLVAVPTVTGYNYCGKDVKLCKANQKHIMCDIDSIPMGAEYKAHVPMTRSIMMRFIMGHNGCRDKIASGEQVSGGGEKFPPAARMRELLWDEELAYIAHTHAGRCNMEHDECRATSRYPRAGQNLYKGCGTIQSNVTDAIDAAVAGWFSETTLVKDPTTITAWSSSHMEAGHLTVMIQERVARLGCAIAFCMQGNQYCYHTTCNYDYTNVAGRPIYTAGQRPAEKCGDWGTSPHGFFKNLCKNSGENFNKGKL